ncbi:hypothetical protein [Chryseobacterium sp. 3008163]|uniref:hypothetical protein n=1 Tax=Chryseobacterium sp. 3008163 TaxID=2478663 RepID=UPI000F0CA627|nr:hypothetical protein [Chryseobacterium sp. 3008163]AYN00624.1 hypothetical protein EAG08_10125 [Chryseobacterium sp. 3008163]
MEKKEKFDSDFNKKDITTSAWFWNYMEDYWHNNREFPESVENHLNRKADLVNGKVPSSQLPNYLPLTGGAVTGNTFIKPRLAIQRTTDNSDFIAINAGTNKAVVKNPDNPSEENVFIGWFKSDDFPAVGNAPYCQLNHSNARMALRAGVNERPDCTLIVNGKGYIDNIVTNTHGTSQDWKQAFDWGNHNFAGYLKARGAHQDAYAANIDYPISITDYAGGTGFHSTYGNSLHIKGINTWHSRLDIPTDGDRIELWQGINTTTMSKRGYLPVIEEGQNVATQSWVANNYGNQTLSVGNEGNVGQQLTLSNGNSVQITNNFVACRDGSRNPNDIKPNENGQRVRYDFANANTVGGSGNYAGVMTYSPWDGTTASTGDSSYQLAFANQIGLNAGGAPMLKIRNGIDNTWSNTWYKIWSEGDFSKTDINNWNNIANTATTQSWVESQDYATHSFVEESLNKIASEHIDPDYSISARSNLNTIIITDQYPVQFLKLESDLAPGKQMTIINTAPFDIEVHKDGNIVDIVRSEETNEYYITRQQRLVKKGFYGNAKILS